MKKVLAIIMSAAILISCCGCEFLFRQDPIPVETEKLPSPTPTADAIPPSVEPTTEPTVVPSATPEVPEPIESEAPEETPPPENAEELTIYMNGTPLTAVVIPYTAPLREGVLDFTMHYDSSSYVAEYKNNAYTFRPLAEDADPLDYIEISYISGGKSESILPSFADSYIDFTDIEFSSYSSVGADALSAESVIAYNSTQYITAYLIDVSGGLITVVISSSTPNTENFSWFNAMVGTFSIE